MSKEIMIGALSEAYDGLLIAADAAVTRGDTRGSWSVREVLAHAAAWEAEAMRRIPILADGGTDVDYTDPEVDTFNAAVAARVAEHPLHRVRDDFAQTHERLVSMLNRMDEAAFAPGGAAHRWVAALTEHAAEHAREQGTERQA